MRWLFRVTAWERVSLWRRLPCAFGRVAALFALLVGLINVLGPPITIFFTARWESRKIPALKVTPLPLRDYSVSDAPGTTLSYFGYSFEVPWNANFKTRGTQKASDRAGRILFQFESGQRVLLISPENQNGLLTELVQDQSLQMGSLRTVFGDLINHSAYDQYSTLLNTTPSTIRAFGPRAEAARSITLLTIKSIALPASLETGAFSFELPDKRGFQIGDPRKSRGVQLEVLDVNGRYVEIICGTDKPTIRLTQPELNRILRTLHTVPVNSVALNTGGTGVRD